MADTDTYSRARPLRVDSQNALSLGLVFALVAGGIQYGRQSERLDSVERQLALVTAKLEKLTDAINALPGVPHSQR